MIEVPRHLIDDAIYYLGGAAGRPHLWALAGDLQDVLDDHDADQPCCDGVQMCQACDSPDRP